MYLIICTAANFIRIDAIVNLIGFDNPRQLYALFFLEFVIHHYTARFKEIKTILIIALPLIISQVLQVGMGVIDTVMAGQIGALPLAAVAMGSAVWFFVLLMGMGLMRVMPAIISQYRGAKNFPAIREEVRQCSWMALFLGGVSVILLLGVSELLWLIDIDSDIVPVTQEYIYWISWSLPFSCFYLVPRYFNEGMGFTLPMLILQLITMPLNIFGNWLFMYGNAGFAPMGGAGAALATGLSQSIGCILLVLYTFYGKRYQEYDLRRRITMPDWGHLWQNLKLGVPIAVSMGMEAGLFSVVTLLMGKFGVDAVASHQIALNIASLAFMVPLGISMALTIRVGEAIGSSEPKEAKLRGQMGILLCISFCALSAILFTFEGAFLSGVYTNESHLITLATELLLLAALFQLVDGLQVGAAGALLGYKDTKIPMIISVICYWGGGLTIGVVSSVHLGYGPKGLWYGLVAGLALAAAALNIRLHFVSRQAIEESLTTVLDSKHAGS